jgi:hypothetical protein
VNRKVYETRSILNKRTVRTRGRKFLEKIIYLRRKLYICEENYIFAKEIRGEAEGERNRGGRGAQRSA